MISMKKKNHVQLPLYQAIFQGSASNVAKTFAVTEKSP